MPLSSSIIDRIVKESGFPALANFLGGGLSPGDLQSLLMHVYRTRAAGVTEADVMRTSERPLLSVADIDARLLQLFDRVAFEAAAGFEAVDLSPVAAAGLNRLLGEIDQNNVLSTIRKADVIGDPTAAMAVECARRRRANPALVRLCNSHRAVRLQPLDVPGYRPHFRLLSLVTAGRDSGGYAFEIASLTEHLRFYLLLFRGLNENGFVLQEPLVELSETNLIRRLLSEAAHGVTPPKDLLQAPPELGWLEKDVVAPLKAEFPEAEFRYNLARLEGLNYYRGVMLRISPVAPDGERYPIVDGGFTNWTARLLQNRKERLLTSGIGTEFVCRRYRTP
jgi:hypothetical protein